jgi:hypothetical protein
MNEDRLNVRRVDLRNLRERAEKAEAHCKRMEGVLEEIGDAAYTSPATFRAMARAALRNDQPTASGF